MMDRSIHSDAMPAYLRRTMLDGVVEVVDYLQDVLRYCAPDRACHGWGRMCMYQASDAMDTLGRLAGVIAAQLVNNGLSRRDTQRILRSEQECLRTEQPPRNGVSYSRQDLECMPSWLYEQVQTSVAQVVLRLNQLVEESRAERNREWFRRCLYQLSLMMDELGGLNQLIAAVNSSIMSQDTLARYQHLFQQRSRKQMPDSDDERLLAGLLGRPEGCENDLWYAIGRFKAGRQGDPPRPESHEGRVLRTLAALDSALQPLRWNDADGRLLDGNRSTVISCLNALTALEYGDEDDFPPLYWLSPHEQIQAVKALDLVFGAGTYRAMLLANPRAAAGAEARK